MQQNDILIYTDAGSHLNYKGKEKLLQYIEQAKINDIWINKLGEELSDIKYTKADTISLFKNRLSFDDVLKEGQIQATNIIMVKNKYTINIIKQWKKYMDIKELHYIDDSDSILPNNPDFIVHRHDQSILSLLLKCNHYTFSENCKTWASDVQSWKELEQTEPILNKRDKHIEQYYSLRDRLAKIKQEIKNILFK